MVLKFSCHTSWTVDSERADWISSQRVLLTVYKEYFGRLGAGPLRIQNYEAEFGNSSVITDLVTERSKRNMYSVTEYVV